MTSFKDAIKSSKQGVILRVHVVPGSSQSLFPAGYNQWRKCIEIKVRSEAKDNKANNEVIKTVAEFFKDASERCNSDEWTEQQGENHFSW